MSYFSLNSSLISCDTLVFSLSHSIFSLTHSPLFPWFNLIPNSSLKPIHSRYQPSTPQNHTQHQFSLAPHTHFQIYFIPDWWDLTNLVSLKSSLLTLFLQSVCHLLLHRLLTLQPWYSVKPFHVNRWLFSLQVSFFILSCFLISSIFSLSALVSVIK